MKEPEHQSQHRVSQVYLKHFGYQEKEKWYISIYKHGSIRTENILIKDFSKEINIFDLPFNDFNLKHHFENTSNKIENEYNKLINTIAAQKRIIPRHQDLIRHFIANYFCRATVNQTFIGAILENPETQDKFINEISIFQEDKKPIIKELLQKFHPKTHLNLLLGFLMNHLVRVFRSKSFCQVILKDFDNRGWVTSENPIVIDKKGNSAWIISLSRKYIFLCQKITAFSCIICSHQIKTIYLEG